MILENEISYKPLIDDMVWSYSRIGAFEQCPYRWYIKYISVPKPKSKKMFFSEYGRFVHEILEKYYKKEIEWDELKNIFVTAYKDNVPKAPNNSLFKSYFKGGCDFFGTQDDLFDYEVIDVERYVEFEVDGVKFQGFIDLVCKDSNGDIIIIDHKSRALKPRSTRKKPTKTDLELDKYLRQLYLYSIPVKEIYGKYPSKLCFNCFRTQIYIEEPFSEEKLNETIEWVKGAVDEISETTDFKPLPDYFKCNHLCEMQDECWMYELSKRK